MTVATEALVGRGIEPQPDIGFEVPARAVQLMLLEHLDEKLGDQEERWKQADLAFQEITGFNVGQIELERFDAHDIHDGPHRSILKAPPERFPALSVMCYLETPKVAQFDQFDTYNFRLFVEVFVKSGQINDETESLMTTILHRRAQRTTEAVHAVIAQDSNLMGSCLPGIQRPPRGSIGKQSWVQADESSRFLWQGARLEYEIERHTSP